MDRKGLLKVLLFLLGFMIFSALYTYPISANNTVKDLRYSSEVDRFRFVLELEREPDYSFFYLESPSRIVIDLKKTSYPLETRNLSLTDPSVESIRVGVHGLDLRFVFDLTEYITNFAETILRDPYRLVIDIFRDEVVEVTDYQVLVTPGLYYRQIHRKSLLTPLLINILEVDLSSRFSLRVLPVLAQGRITGGEEVSSISRRYQAIAAINGTFFDGLHRPLGLLVINGLLVSEPILGRTAIGFKENGEILMDRVHTLVEVRSPSITIPVDGVNRPAQEGEIILFNHLYGLRISADESTGFVIREGQIIKEAGPGEILPTDGFILSARGSGALDFHSLQVGDFVTIETTYYPSPWNEGLLHAVGGGPRLVKDGEKYISSAEESFRSDVVMGRAPRTALGITENGRLLMVTVSGRTVFSRGMTLDELADLMLDLGAVNAMNLDGGGSTTMVLRQRLFNQPSSGDERRVSNALLLLPY